VFVVLIIQHAMRMCEIVFCDLPRSTPFFHFIINGTIFGKKDEHKTCVLVSSTAFFFPPNTSHSKKKWGRCGQNCVFVFIWSTRYSCQILMNLSFVDGSSEKITEISNFVKLRRVGAEFHANRRTDRRDESNSLFFRNFGNSPKNWIDS
jgi:hypothetical protein